MVVENWQRCTEHLKQELPAQQFNTWIRPLRAELDANALSLYAPNKFILDWVKGKYLNRISELVGEQGKASIEVRLLVGSAQARRDQVEPSRPQCGVKLSAAVSPNIAPVQPTAARIERARMDTIIEGKLKHRGALNQDSTFDNFIVGKSNQLARAAAMQVA